MICSSKNSFNQYSVTNTALHDANGQVSYSCKLNERENVHVSDPRINGKLIASVVTK